MFYYNFIDLCNKIGKSPSAVAEDMGYKRSVVTRWSKGTAPRQATLQRIADYFGVSVGYLLGTEDKKEKPTVSGGLGALIPGYDDLSEENKRRTMEYIELLLLKQKGADD